MKFNLSAITALVLLAAPFASAVVPPKKHYVVSFNNDTPQSVIDKAIKDVEATGGIITHKYNLIKGFAVYAPEKTMSTVSTLDSKYGPTVEEDQEVHALENGA
ncbi:hypothetical protein BJ508DRAFT_412488 [Ascobolus immersus RN42]|uniref:Inhibitor I9 domain-containing protein n=1 Tax=Ascobolus immersus RN42 TaxID=1160509 RepID=A0A3N4IGI9_ASCIM|nr:hypothetical protein BJ508DRAFT_412488 [Ascobolus immersus RN42]